jgi:hypothetical protein
MNYVKAGHNNSTCPLTFASGSLGQGKKIILAQKGKYVSSDSNGFSRNIYK